MHAGKDKPDGLGDQRLRRMLQAWRPPGPEASQHELAEGIIEASCVALYGRTEGKSTALAAGLAALLTTRPTHMATSWCLECGAAPPRAGSVTMRCALCSMPETCPAQAAVHCAGCPAPTKQCAECHDWLTDYMAEEKGLRCDVCGDLYCAGCWQNATVGDVVDDNRFLCRGCRSNAEGT
jgi:hypothetical protein